MKKRILLITTLFFVALTFNALFSYAFSTSYVYVKAFYEGTGASAKYFDVQVHEGRSSQGRKIKTGTARSADGKEFYVGKLAAGKVYFVRCRDASWSGGTQFRVTGDWNTYVKVRMQNYGSKAGWRRD